MRIMLRWLPCVLVQLLGRAPLVHASEPYPPPTPTTASTSEAVRERALAVWFQPVGAVATAVGGRGTYLPFGVNIPLTPRTSFVLELTAISANWYGCGSKSSGYWAAAGVAFATGSNASHHGFFLEPKLAVRQLETSGARSSGGWFGCAASNINQSETSIKVGLDVGYQLVWGRLFVTPIVGASMGACLNCGDLLPNGLRLFSNDITRRDRFGVDLNLNLLRIGFAF